MAVPPSDVGASNVTVNSPLEVGVIPEMTGALAVVVGIPVTAVLASPPPCVFIARIITEYGVPLVRPLIINGLVVVPELRASHVSPPSMEY